MGPWAFMAPELEQGGQLDVTPSADLYSLGKVIYYMLSGGVILPRERLFEPQYRKVFDKGERYRFIEHLLSRMVCTIDQRIQTVDEVLSQLKQLQDWEQNARTIRLAPEALAGIDQMQKRSMESARILAENRSARDLEKQSFALVQESLVSWFRVELEKVATLFQPSSISAKVDDAAIYSQARVQTGRSSRYSPVNGVEIAIEDANDQGLATHHLQLLLCRHEKAIVSFVEPGTVQRAPAVDAQLAILPLYVQTRRIAPNTQPMVGFFKRSKSGAGNNRAPRVAPRVSISGTGRRLVHQFDLADSLHFQFRASEWPANENQVSALLSEAFDAFIAHINGN